MFSADSLKLLSVPILVISLLLIVPFVMIANESLHPFVPGLIGSKPGSPITLDNYIELVTPGYLKFFFDTFRISAITSAIAVIFALPISYWLAHVAPSTLRRLLLVAFVSLLFLSILVRTYAIGLAVGPTGFGRNLAALLGLGINSKSYAEVTVVLGLLHCVLPMVILTLLAPLQNLNPRLVDAAQSLGASQLWAHVSVTLPLASRALTSGFIVAFTFCVSAFVIPMVLGKGRVLFIGNIIYGRFGEAGNYPSGSAFAITLLIASVLLVHGSGAISSKIWQR